MVWLVPDRCSSASYKRVLFFRSHSYGHKLWLCLSRFSPAIFPQLWPCGICWFFSVLSPIFFFSFQKNIRASTKTVENPCWILKRKYVPPKKCAPLAEIFSKIFSKIFFFSSSFRSSDAVENRCDRRRPPPFISKLPLGPSFLDYPRSPSLTSPRSLLAPTGWERSLSASLRLTLLTAIGPRGPNVTPT